jgi:serine protease Do
MLAPVKHLPLTLAAASLTAIGSFASAPAAAQTGGGGPPPPPQNGTAAQTPAAQAAPAVSAAPAATSSALTRQQVNERVRRGLVVLKKNGTPMAIGTVIGDDGRILTALSGLGGASRGAEAAEVVYADGTVAVARIGNMDRQSDLALLIPLARPSDRWTDGLSASGLDPASLPLRAIVPTQGARLAPTEAEVKGLAEVHAHDGQALPHMLDLDVKGPVFAGAPMLDARGDVLALLVKACKGAAPVGADPGADAWAAWERTPQTTAGPAECTPVVVGAPVVAIRSFLMSAALGAAPAAARAAAPAVAPAPAPWLGIRVEPQTSGSVRGVQVVAVAPKSPAQSAALKPAADIIAAVDGDWVDSPEALAGAIGMHDVGDTVKLLIFNQGKFREVPVVLRAAP